MSLQGRKFQASFKRKKTRQISEIFLKQKSRIFHGVTWHNDLVKKWESHVVKSFAAIEPSSEI